MKQHQSVWRRANERYKFECSKPMFKSNYRLVNVWGAFSYDSRTSLIRIRGTFTKDKYKKILQETLLPYAESVFCNVRNFLLQEYNCSVHRASAIRQYLSSKQVVRMTWTPQSPDLSPVENVWGLIKRKLRSLTQYPRNEDELFETVEQMWPEIPQLYFQRLVASMPNRARSVVNRKGSSTKY